MSNKNEVSTSDLETMLLCTLRYSMGRMSYVPGLCQELLDKHSNALSASFKRMVVREVTEEVERAERMGTKLGFADQDLAWREFAKRWLSSLPC